MSSHAAARFLALAAVLPLLLADPAEAFKRRAFATSVTGTADLGSWADAGTATGIEAGNEICQARAAEAGLSNSGLFRAWLSDGTTDAFCNVQGLSGKKSANCNGQSLPIQGPWFFADGSTHFAAGLLELTQPRAEIYRPILADEFGDLITIFNFAWTGTTSDGTGFGFYCNDWQSASASLTGVVGSTRSTSVTWTHWGGIDCAETLRLLCFESLPGEAPEPIILPGSLAFVTSETGPGDLDAWPEAGGESGIEAGDAICRSLAADAGLPAPDSFVAWLSDSTHEAADRVTSGGPFRRLDGYAIAVSHADLVDGATLNSLHVDELGRYADFDYEVRTATNGQGEYDGPSCSNWTSTAGTGVSGRAARTRTAEWTAGIADQCTGQSHLYCFSNVVTLFWDGFELTGDTSRWDAVAP